MGHAPTIDRVKSSYPGEQAYAGPECLGSGYVAACDRKAQFDPTEDVPMLLDAGMNRESITVDLGAGTGTFAFAAAPHFPEVITVDVSATMVKLLRQRVEEPGITNIRVVHAGFLSQAHQGACADLIVLRIALHQLPDLWKAAVVAPGRNPSMLRPSGIVARAT